MVSNHVRSLLVLVLTAAAAGAAPLHAQGVVDGAAPATPRAGPPQLAAHRVEAAAGLEIDGRLDEAAWAAATPITDLMQVEPAEGVQPSQRTEIRVVYDEDALWIGAKMFQDPDDILAYQ